MSTLAKAAARPATVSWRHRPGTVMSSGTGNGGGAGTGTGSGTGGAAGTTTSTSTGPYGLHLPRDDRGAAEPAAPGLWPVVRPAARQLRLRLLSDCASF
jgi:hypothetical protein